MNARSHFGLLTRKLMLLAIFVFLQCCFAVAQTRPIVTGFLVDGVVSNWAAVGATLTIQGSGFGATIGFSSATLNGILLAGPGVRPISWSDTSIVTVTPRAVSSGPVVVQVKRLSSKARRLNVRVEITQVWCATGPCDSAPVGALVSLGGLGFGTVQGKVTFNGVEAVTGAWTDSSIPVVVPEGATTGPIRVMEQGVYSNPWPFTITP